MHMRNRMSMYAQKISAVNPQYAQHLRLQSSCSVIIKHKLFSHFDSKQSIRILLVRNKWTTGINEDCHCGRNLYCLTSQNINKVWSSQPLAQNRHWSSKSTPPEKEKEPHVPEKLERKKFGVLGEKTLAQTDKSNIDRKQVLDNFVEVKAYVKENSPDLHRIGNQIAEKSSVLLGKISSAALAVRNDRTSDTSKKKEDWNDILNRWYGSYQDFVGITELKRAQDRVIELTASLLNAQGQRRSLHAEVEQQQELLISTHQRITKTELYSEDHYKLFESAREINNRLKILRTEFEACESAERDTFTHLSAAIRDCHERERTQAEQSKYWSIIASIISAAIASVITSLNNWVRIREIKDHATKLNSELREGYDELRASLLSQSQNIVNNLHHVTGQIESSLKNVVPASSLTNASNPENSQLPSPFPPPPPPPPAPLPTSEIPPPPMVVDINVDINQISSAIAEKVQESVSKELLSVFVTEKENFLEELKLLQEQMKIPKEDISSAASSIAVAATDISSAAKDISLVAQENVTAISDSAKIAAEVGDTIIGAPVTDFGYRKIGASMVIGAGIGVMAATIVMGFFSGQV
ncbi:uncharacterized protein LOC143039382 [Oratosquilla oratoria]|uniref:uncharacterized protein LOC143039382 n=1 Tax=Oratosquilla oratoria TaxID=337810 RepID=UPI003F76AE6C